MSFILLVAQLNNSNFKTVAKYNPTLVIYSYVPYLVINFTCRLVYYHVCVLGRYRIYNYVATG